MRFKSRFQSRLKSGFTSRFTLDSGVFRFSASAAGGGYSYTNTEAATFEAAADTTSWDDAFRADLDQLYSDLKSGQVNGTNTLATLDMLYALDQPNSASSLRCLIDPTRTATAVNSPTFTAGQGFTGDGSTSYIDTNYNPSTDATNYAQNSANLSVWVRTASGDPSPNPFRYYAGSFDGAGVAIARDGNTDPYSVFGPNLVNFLNGTTLSPSATGLLSGNRSGALARQTYRNATLEGSDLGASVAITAPNIYVLAVNNAGSAALFNNGQVSAVSAGGSLTANQHADLYDALNRYRTAREAA